MRKAACALLMAFLLLPPTWAEAVEAGQQVNLTLSWEVEAIVGETIEVEMLLTENPGIFTAQATLAYNSNVLACTSCRTGPAMADMMCAANPNAEGGAIVAGASASAVEGTGVLAVYQFKVLSAGDYGFAVKDMLFADSTGTKFETAVTYAAEPSSESAQLPAEPGTSAGDLVAFTDTQGNWAEPYIHQAVQLDLVNGYGNGRYGPNDTMTRAHFVTILWREAGGPEPVGPASFTDLDPKQTYYHKAVAWAEENGVVNGVGNGRFAPNDSVTREQIAATLYRLEGGAVGPEQMFYGIYEQAFTDSALISDWAEAAVWWAIYREIWCGTDSAEAGQALMPKDAANRAQIAVMMVRYHGS